MAQRSIKVMECDRCGYLEEFRGRKTTDAWGQAYYKQLNGPAWIASQQSPADICPKCLDHLHWWWGSGKEKR